MPFRCKNSVEEKGTSLDCFDAKSNQPHKHTKDFHQIYAHLHDYGIGIFLEIVAYLFCFYVVFLGAYSTSLPSRLMAHPVGLEPTAYCLEGSCSIHLSYGCIYRIILPSSCSSCASCFQEQVSSLVAFLFATYLTRACLPLYYNGVAIKIMNFNRV